MEDNTQGSSSMSQRLTDPPMRITREIPTPWLIGGAISLIAHGAMTWQSLQTLVVEVKEMRQTAGQYIVKIIEVQTDVAELKRRMAAHEAEHKNKP